MATAWRRTRSSADQQQGLRAQRLVEHDVGGLFAALVADLPTQPPSLKPSSPAGSWTTPSSETFSLDDDLSHSVLLPLLRPLGCFRSPDGTGDKVGVVAVLRGEQTVAVGFAPADPATWRR
jgi:hypothetical protein